MNHKKSFALAAFATMMMSSAAWSGTELTVYTAIEAEDLKRYAESFIQDHPDIKLNFIRDSTGVITAKLLAEKDNPQADVIWGLAATSLLVLKSEGMLEAYAPKGVEQLKPNFIDKDTPPSWVGMDAWAASICFNTVEGQKLGLTAPKSWKDLIKPEYKGHVVMPNPASSGTGFLDVSSWLQLFGEKDGWSYMDGLHQNVATYTHSGSKPCKMAAAGETVIGISFEFRAAKSKAEGAPLDIVIPSEGIGWDMEASAIVAGTANEEAAKTLLDWSISKKANEMYNVGYAVVAMPGVAKPVQYLPADIEDKMIKNDFEWAANNRKAILEEWTKRYDSKSEPKS
ncbi:putative 2-aminoethylphosphonate ABC transporter substrate-binding protein [Aminobacter anthyllidis]|uniref:2-aminoethylphosphonate ABC transporter substrate-binding protein n=1 Tax=Aminobacter anthyllidis TaxID=1035067 RepID=A0A9X1D6I7_9HYPH|nr:putative 2-aminoethylphosphonate ABC transporter substrate-binding protein [Aminobacter anthyllidis]MBT1157081.1 putative 2-aminoethylphosphonate ABC transporter substrate-binding protein [Aminobacter anthyllidis]